MVRGWRGTSSGGRGEGSGRRFTSFSTPLPLTSASLPPAVGPTTSVPIPPTSALLPPAVGPTTSAPLPQAASRLTTSAPLLPVAGGLTASASPSHMASGSTPPPSEPVHADDETSHHEGEGSYNETMRGVWINEGYRNHRFTEHSDELRARFAWTTTTRANFKHLMYNVRKNAERASASTDKNQWKEHGPVWMRKEYWTELCDISGARKWNENSSKAKQNIAAHPEANESYSRGMDERYGDDTSGEPKKGHVYGFGHSLGTTRVISSCSSSVSHATSPFTTPAALGGSSSAAPTMTPDMFMVIVNETVSQNISTIVSQTVSQMLAELGIPGNRAPPAQQPPDHPSRDVGRDDDQDDTYMEDL
ncbi:hypothetical protein Taro_055708 [Colocasia esculenta]|uniref:Uncharacterized protein n=1 Tax=Colocasia esculenta TaxID=4460 RepID=A0A843XU74_COLES|nr:hypothetical protein [Colocasia esculenta]